MKRIMIFEIPDGTKDLFLVQFFFEEHPIIRVVEKNQNELKIDQNPFRENQWETINIFGLNSENIKNVIQGKEYLRFYLEENKYFKPFREKYQHLLGNSS